MDPSFWDERFGAPDTDYVYGTAPNAFLAAQANRLPTGAEVIALGAGEGRNAVYYARQGFTVTAADYAERGLAKTRRLAEKAGVSVETIAVDVTTWRPERPWDAVLIAFLHLPPADQPTLYRLIPKLLRPGGRLIATWFRPEQRTEGYTSGGPPRPEMMVTPAELEDYFSRGTTEMLETPEVTLDEGTHHRGPAAVVHFVWRKDG
jgi:SAM-dependent methyltransferase